VDRSHRRGYARTQIRSHRAAAGADGCFHSRHRLFPIILSFLLRLRGGLEIAAMLLMLLARSGTSSLRHRGRDWPSTDLKERRKSTIPSVGSLATPVLRGFSLFVTGMVMLGGAWNASHRGGIFHFQGKIVSTATRQHPSAAPANRRFDVLLASTLIMATTRAHQPLALAGDSTSGIVALQTANLTSHQSFSFSLRGRAEPGRGLFTQRY